MILDLQRRNDHIRLVDVKIEEFEIENKVEVEGVVTRDGEYEDYTQLIGGTDISNIIGNYQTRKIKVIIELLD